MRPSHSPRDANNVRPRPPTSTSTATPTRRPFSRSPQIPLQNDVDIQIRHCRRRHPARPCVGLVQPLASGELASFAFVADDIPRPIAATRHKNTLLSSPSEPRPPPSHRHRPRRPHSPSTSRSRPSLQLSPSSSDSCSARARCAPSTGAYGLARLSGRGRRVFWTTAAR